MSLPYLYPSLLGFFALLVGIGALVALVSFRARSRSGDLARRFERSVVLIGAASMVVLAGAVALLYATLSTTDLREEAESFLFVLSAGLVVTLCAWIPFVRWRSR